MKKMRLMFLGPPGAGKGTQAKELSKILGVAHISTGDIFREVIHQDSDHGRNIREILSRGQLVPDELTINIVKEKLAQPELQNGFILDGFPRNLKQAEALDRILAELGRELGYVLELDLPEPELVARLVERRGCSQCGKIHNLSDFSDSDQVKCRSCSGELVEREDDRPEVIHRRLQVYREHTAPLINFYQQQGKLKKIKADQPMEKVLQDILGVLKNDSVEICQ